MPIAEHSPTARVAARSLRSLHSALIAFAGAWCLAWFLHAWGYWEDDSYIHLVFARSVSLGKGFAFDGRTVYGDTSPLWVFLLVGFHKLIPEWIVGGKILSALGVTLATFGVYALSRRLTARSSGSVFFALFMVVLLVVNPYFCYWSFSGMEAVTAAGVVCLAAVAADPLRPANWKLMAGAALCGIGPLLRPELSLFLGLASLLLLRQWWTLHGNQPATRSWAVFAFSLLLLLGPLALWAHYALHAFGALLPTTNAAKHANPGEIVPERLLLLYGLGFPIAFFTPIAALVRARQPRGGEGSSRGMAGLPLAGWTLILWSLICAAFYIKDATHIQTRYLLANGPGLTVACMAILLRRLPRRIFTVIAAAVFCFAISLSIYTVWPFIGKKSANDAAAARMANYIDRTLPPGSGVSDYAIGEIAFLTTHPVIDTGGITRPAVLRIAPDQVTAWTKSQGAQYAITGSLPEPGAILIHTEPLLAGAWALRRSTYRHQEQLCLWKLAPPSGSQKP